MAWYRIAGNVLDAIANAINAKTGHTAPMTPVEMVSEIQSIPTGGGGSLPSVISKIDGGTFTYATDEATQSNKINHNLGVKPKGFIVYSESVMMDDSAYAQQTIMFSYGIGLPWVNAGITHSIGYSYFMSRKTNGGVQEASTDSPTITDTQIAPAGYNNWRGGVTYKWLAWA